MIPHNAPAPERALEKEIAAYNDQKAELIKSSRGKWVVYYDCQFQGAYNNFEEAAQSAVSKFGRGPYLIRQVGDDDVTLPASVVYTVSHAAA